MRTQFSKIVLAAGIVLAMALTFSCSSDKDDGNPGTSPSHEHVWGDWEVVTAPTCGTKGERKRTCTSDPSHVEMEDIDKLPYDNTTLLCDARDGKLYKFVSIGTEATAQTWMAENLNYDVPDNATDVCYDNNPANCVTYGRLYNWETAMGGSASSSKNPSEVQGVCPSGWHLPSDAEWNALTKFVNPSCSDNSNCGGAGTKLKSTNGWNSYEGKSGNGTDEFGFSALPGGNGRSDGSFGRVGETTPWWSSTEYDASSVYGWNMYYNSADVSMFKEGDKTRLYSVRCVQD
ncbi:MAG: fibrobacter succinogenes major paralogous domain-containing protein [Fibromonadaceae bacterium]|jgi:uncharacterized protein (TIGR02145 family)|nr:fibrobacter succinogenes major paralogous domain-containing protein [Fibromonadaceae bacterium]